MNIVLFVHQSAEMYGSDKVLLFIARGLLSTGKFHPVVVLPEEGPLHSALLDSGVEVHVGEVVKVSRAVFSPAGVIRLVRKMVSAVRRLDSIVGGRDVGMVHSNTLAVLAGAFWALLRRRKHLWHVHEIVLSPKVVSKAFPWLVNRLSSRVVSNSTMTERWLLGEQPSLASKSIVVFNGLPPVDAPSEAAIRAFRESVGAGDDAVVVTLAGRINRWKGQELLLQAVSLLKQRGRLASLRIVIVGGAAPGLEELPSRLQAQAEASGVAEFCQFVPFIKDIWPVWFGTDIAVVPSTEPEPFGMVAIEAMAAGVPVIAAGHGGLLDIVEVEQTGLIFPPRNVSALADSIERLAADRVLRKQLGSAGALRQRGLFSIQSQVDRTAKVYEEMLA